MVEKMHPLITRDPVSGGELIVTRLECPDSGIVIEGKFSLGWMARLTAEQLAFVGLLVKHRGNIQKLAAELNVAYNTARNHMDDIVAALESPPQHQNHHSRLDTLNRLSIGEISFEDAIRDLED